MTPEQFGKKLGTYTIDWLYFAVFFFIFAAIGYLGRFNSFTQDFALVYILVWIGAYYLSMFLLRQMRPRIYVYENGIFVVERDNKQFFPWAELTHFEGQRRDSIRINGFPVWRTGANQFFAGKNPAFRIGALTNGADALVDYCMSRIAEKHLPACEATIKRGEALQLGHMSLQREGIESGEHFYSWLQIKSVYLEQVYGNQVYDVNASLEGKLLDEHLGVLKAKEAYVFLGLVDRLTGSSYLPKAQMMLISPLKQLQQNKGFIFAIGLTLLVMGITFIFALYRNA